MNEVCLAVCFRFGSGEIPFLNSLAIGGGVGGILAVVESGGAGAWMGSSGRVFRGASEVLERGLFRGRESQGER
jgi:hypothetical protein